MFCPQHSTSTSRHDDSGLFQKYRCNRLSKAGSWRVPGEGFVLARLLVFQPSAAASSFPGLISPPKIQKRGAGVLLSLSTIRQPPFRRPPARACVTTERGFRLRTWLEKARLLDYSRGRGRAALGGPGKRFSPPARPSDMFSRTLAGERQKPRQAGRGRAATLFSFQG